MAPSSERTRPSVAERLAKEPWRFDFFQAVRLLEQIDRERAGRGSNEPRSLVGNDGPAARELARFHAVASHSFPAATVAALRGLDPQKIASSSTQATSEPAPVALDVPFIGLFGPQGVLPQHYTQLVIDRTRKKDFSLRDFLDIFNHRVISYFYRAWEKYRFAIGYERALLKQESDPAADEDLFTSCLFSLVGMAPPSLRGRMDFSDRILLYYAAHFTQRTRTAWALGAMIQDYFDVPTRIDQFRGQWLYLSAENQSKLSADVDADNLNNRLGMDVIVGDRVW
ncbi:MAG: hypothetical protein RIS70_3870, partial [Planctomycetota bacterium]